jgi:hypothetical protein
MCSVILRTTTKLIALTALAAGATLGVWLYRDRTGASREIARLQQEKQALKQVVGRLSDEKRVAELIVTEQTSKPSGELSTTLLFVEYTKGGTSLPPKTFTIDGEVAHVDALVIKFDRHFVEEGDPLRGRSIALFTRIYGDKQSPAEAARIDKPGEVPEIYRDADPRVTRFEQRLWQDFWRLTTDSAYRAEHGVRVAMGQGVWGMFQPGRLYTVTLESDGGLSLTSEPMKGIYREALKNPEAPKNPEAGKDAR